MEHMFAIQLYKDYPSITIHFYNNKYKVGLKPDANTMKHPGINPGAS